MTAFWRTRRGSRGFCGHRHESLDSAARCAHVREVRYEVLGEPAQVEVLAPGDRPLTDAERLLIGRVMAGLSAPPARELMPLPVLVSRAALLTAQLACERCSDLGLASDLATEALARLLVEADRKPPHRAPRVRWRAVEA